MTVLMSAASSDLPDDQGPLQCVKLVVDHRGNLDSLHQKRITALIFAVKAAHFNIVKYFLEHGGETLIDLRDMNTRSVGI